MNNPPRPPYPRSSPRPSASSADKKSSSSRPFVPLRGSKSRSPARRQQITANPPKSQFRQPLRGQKSRSPRPSAPSADKKAVLPALLLTLLLAACGRQPAEPTPLPPGTPVVQPTPDFSAPAQIGSANQTADQAAQALRTRLAQQRVQPTPAVSPAVPLTPSPSPLTPAVPLDASLDVFNRPNALGILSAGGILYAAPNGAVRATLQVGATLTITGRSADRAWYAAYLADGVAGWVPAAQVRVFGDTDELEIVQESLGPAVVATLIAQASQPQDPISAVVVRLTATTTPAETAPDPAPQPTAAAITGPAITGPAVTVIVEGANLRAGPGTDFPVVDVLYQNQTAALTGRNPAGDWLQLQRPTGPAWIFAPLVQTTVPTADLPIIQAP